MFSDIGGSTRMLREMGDQAYGALHAPALSCVSARD